MKYTLWFYDMLDGESVKRYEVMTGSRYACYKRRKQLQFSWQYKVQKCSWE